MKYSIFNETKHEFETFGGAEIDCLVAQRVLEISAAPEFLSHVNHLADEFAEQLESLRSRHSNFFIAVRQLGLMMGLVLKDAQCGPILTKTAYDRDLLMIYANNDPGVCQLLPPLVMDPGRIGWIIQQLDGALAAARRLKTVVGVKAGIGQIVNKVLSK